MKFIFFCLLNLFLSATISAQQQIDSLKNLLTGEADTTQLSLFKTLSEYYYSSNKDSMHTYLQKSLQLAEQMNRTNDEIKIRNTLSEVYYRNGNYPEALKFSLEALQRAEQLKDTDNIFWSKRNVMMTYEYMPGEEKRVIRYAEELKDLVHSGFYKDPREIEFKELLGYINHAATYYDMIGRMDSTLYFRQRSYEMSLHLKDDEGIAIAINNLASIHEKMGNQDLALAYYKMSIPYCTRSGRYDILSGTSLALARAARQKGRLDSAFYFTRQALSDIGKSPDPSGLIEVYDALSVLYKETNRYDSSYKYLKLKGELKDSLFSQEKIRNIENQSFAENVRRQELAKQKEKEKAERTQNLRLSALAIFIILFFLFVLLLTRKRKSTLLIGFFSVLSILMIFEFIAMFSHPYIEEWTHHNPFLMLLILVGVASILVPLHHRLEHWIKKRSVAAVNQQKIIP